MIRNSKIFSTSELARQAACRLSNEAVGDGRRIYTRDEIIEAERQGRLLK